MDGSELLRMSHRHLRNFLEELRPGLSQGLDGIKMVVPHQASRLGFRVMRSFGWPDQRVMKTIDQFGNCVSASIPITLYEAVRQERIQRNEEILLAGSGAGLSFGGLILTF